MSNHRKCPACTPDGLETEDCQRRASMQAELDAIIVLAAPCKVCGKTHEMPECVETDIVKRLRASDWRMTARSTMDDAADEIVALRERVKIRDEQAHQAGRRESHYMAHMLIQTVCVHTIEDVVKLGADVLS